MRGELRDLYQARREAERIAQAGMETR